MIRKILSKIGKAFQNKVFGKYESCYSTQQYLGNAVFGNCRGVTSGQCVDCPYLFQERSNRI